MKIHTALLLSLFFSATAFASPVSAPAGDATTLLPEMTATQTPVVNEAPLMVFNREVMVFRSSLLGVSPGDRANRAKARISQTLAENPNAVISTEDNTLGTLFKLDQILVFVITPGDLDVLSQQTMQAAVSDTRSRLDSAIRESRNSRNVDRLLRSIAVSLGVTAIFLFLLWLFGRVRRMIARRLVAITENAHIVVKGVELISRLRILHTALSVNRIVYFGIVVFLLYEWVSICLAQFPYTRPWANGLNAFLVNTASKMGLATLNAMPSLLTATVIFMLAYWLTRISGAFFKRIENKQIQFEHLDAELAEPTRKIAAVVIWLFALVMAYPYLPGSDSAAFKGVSVLVGVMLSLGASSIVSQGASGLILTYSRSFRPGEYVRIGEHEGTITDLGIFNTRMRTGMGEEITLSNSTVFTSVTKNYSRATEGKGYVLDTAVTIGYDTPWRQVEAMLLEAAKMTDGIYNTPAPRVFQTSLTDFYPEYRLVCHAHPAEPRPRAIALSDLHANIQDVFNRYGVQIMSPHYVQDPAKEKTVPEERKYQLPAKPPA